jgi:ubiquinone/menaquinone biosynthesis C-methylase UbiE
MLPGHGRGAKPVTYQWVDCDRDFISRRYDRIADWIVFFEWLLFVPRTLRRQAVRSLQLNRGDCVLELGCGSGRNLPYLREAVGPNGKVYGVDISAGMLAQARKLCVENGWDNVELIQIDAADFVAPKPLDGVLFGLSYNTMPHHLDVLRNAWRQLRRGGRLAVMDAKAPSGPGRGLSLRFGLWLMKHTLLGNPLIEPWKHVMPLGADFRMDEFLFGSYYICHGTRV